MEYVMYRKEIQFKRKYGYTISLVPVIHDIFDQQLENILEYNNYIISLSLLIFKLQKEYIWQC